MLRRIENWLGVTTGVSVRANDHSPVQPAGAPTFEPLEPRLLLNADLTTLQPLLTLDVPSPEQEIHVDLDQRDPDSQADSSPLLTIDLGSGEETDQSAGTPTPSETPVAQVERTVLTEVAQSDSLSIMQDDSADLIVSAQQDNVPVSETLPIEIRGPPALPGLQLADPDISNWQGQVIYLDFDGAQNVTYNGSVTVGPFDVPAFRAPGELAGQEQAIIDDVLARLEETFAGSGVIFTTDKPDQGVDCSTIYIGGDGSLFVEYGSFLGLAEQVDVGNGDRSDEAFVFAASIPSCSRTADEFADRLAQIIAHEAGHLLGLAHEGATADGLGLSSLALSVASVEHISFVNLHSDRPHDCRIVFTDPVDYAADGSGTFTVADISITGPDGGVTSATGIQQESPTAFRVEFAPAVQEGYYRFTLGPNITDTAGNLLDADADGTGGETPDDVTAWQYQAVYLDDQGLPETAKTAHWTADGTTVDSVNQIQGRLVGTVSYQEGISGSAFSLGNSGYVEVPDSDLWDLGGGDFTVCVWAKWSRLDGGSIGNPEDVMIGQDEGGGSRNKWFFAKGGGYLNFHINSPSIGPIFLTRVALTPALGQWYHLVARRSGAEFAIFVDGQFRGAQNWSGTIPNVNAPLLLGMAEGFQFGGGTLDEALIYDRALSAGEIDQVAHASSIFRCLGPVVEGPTSQTGYTDVMFSRPVNTASMSSDQVYLSAPGRTIALDRVEQITTVSYRLHWAQTLTAGNYTLHIGSAVESIDGRYLDQDGDGIGGEEQDDGYSGTLTVDLAGPRITRFKPEGDIAGTVAFLDVWFSESIRSDSFTPADVSILTPAGAIAATSVTNLGLNQCRIQFAPQTRSGAYNVTVGPTVLDLAGNAMDQDRDGLNGESADDRCHCAFTLVDVDLIVSNVQVEPAELFSGSPVHIAWEGANNSGAPLQGSWTDAVYLSVNEAWSIDDIRLGVVPHEGGLTADATYVADLDAVMPGVKAGDYYLLVRADLYNEEMEAADEGNNVVAVPIRVQVHPLQVGGSENTGRLTAADRTDYFAVQTTGGTTLNIELSGLTGGPVQVYVSYAKVPDREHFDFSGTYVGGTNVHGVTANALPGTYYVMIYGDQTSGDIDYLASATAPSIAVTGLSPARHANVQDCTATITGLGFGAATTVEFVAQDWTIHVPVELDVVSSSVLTVILDLPNWALGMYDLRVSNAGLSSVTAEGAFEVVAGEPHLETRLIIPSALGYHWPQTIWLEYENTGTASMPAPLLKLEGSDKALLTLDKDIQQSWWTWGNWWYGEPPAQAGDTVQVLAKGSSLSPGILQPGDSGRIPVYFMGLRQPWNFSDRTITLNLGYLLPEDTTPVDWSPLESEMRPEWWIGDDAWNAVWQNFVRLAGDTWGGYVRLLAGMLNPISCVAAGGAVSMTVANPATLGGMEDAEVQRLLALVFRTADGLNPIRTLAQATDVFTPATGLNLSFDRVYQQPISRRNQIGPLGRGWTCSWQMFLRTNAAGDLAIYDATGTPRIFDRQPNGTFTPRSQTDDGRLVLQGGIYLLTELDCSKTAFNPDGGFSYIQDTNGNRITAGYTSGRLTSLTHSNGSRLLLAYNAQGRIVSVTDPRTTAPDDDYVVIYEYDPSGEYLLSVTEPGGRVTRYTYETAAPAPQRHALLSIEYPDATVRHYAYNELGWLSETYLDDNAERLTFRYDELGKVTMQDAAARTTTFTFLPSGHTAEIRDNAGGTLTCVYDADYRLVSIVGPAGETYRYSYDQRDNVSAIEDPLRQVTTLKYEPTFNNFSRITDARGNAIGYTYNSSGNVIAKTYQDGTHEHFTYDAAGNVLTWTNRRGQVVTYTYNARGQITGKDYSTTAGLIDYTYAYDATGNLIRTTGPEGTTSMTYALATDWLTRIEYPRGQWFEFRYNACGQRIYREDQDGNIARYEYDTTGRLDRMTDTAGALIVDYDYDSSGALILKTLGNGVYTTYAYDAVGHLVHLVNCAPAGSILSRFDYTYDTSGRQASMATADGTWTYQYDATGQLVHAVFDSTNSAIEDQDLIYEYDAVGNRIRAIANGVVTNYTTGNMNEYTHVGDATYLYDGDGNLISQTEDGVTTTYTYDIENRLIGVTTPTDTWIYEYDGFGSRVASMHNGTAVNHIVDPIGYGNVAAEYDDSGDLIARYDHGYGLLSRTDDVSSACYYTFSALGNTSELTYSLGTILNSYSYDPFGRPITRVEAVPNAFEYVGESGVMNEDNGLEFMRARYYATNVGRFVSEDPVELGGNDVNFYRYVSNNPAALIDPQGLRWWCGRQSEDTTYGEAIALFRWGASTALYTVSGPSVTLGAGWTAGYGPTVMPYPPYVGSVGVGLYGEASLVGVSSGFSVGVSLLEYGYGKYHKGTWWCGWVKDPPPENDPPTEEGDGGSGDLRPIVDPNDKSGPAGYGEGHFVADGGLLSYQVRFENKPDAGAPAHIVRVTDTLDEDLDLSTLELTEVAFANQVITIPGGRREFHTQYAMTVDNEYVSGGNIVVQVDITLDTTTRQLQMTLVGVDPQTGWLPDDILLGILYPNDETHRGEGYISYLIRPKSGLPSGTVIENQARIYFDWNDPIDTPVALNTLDAGSPASQVDPLPAATTNTEFAVSWSGQDEPGGSGIASYDIYVSDNGGPFGLWLGDTAETSAVFIGELDHTYAFYSVAEDNVGHQESAPHVPDATTTVGMPNGFPTITADNPVVAVPEGTPTENTGTFNDDDLGDVVEVTASVGTVVQAGSRTGTWAWTYIPGDGPTDGQTVSIAATDSEGASAQVTFALVVSNVAPTVDAGVGAAIDEGAGFTGPGSFTDPGTDTWTATVDYGDGKDPQPLMLTGTTFALDHTYLDDGTYTVTVRVTDDDGGVGQDTLSITVSDLDPVASLTGGTALDEGQSGSFDASGSTSAPDDVVGYEWDWNYDGVTFAASGDTGATQSHTWMDDGTYRVAVRVTDDDGSSGVATRTVSVNDLGPVAALTGDAALSEGQAGSFDASGSLSWPDGISSYEWDWAYDGSFDPSGDVGPTQSHAWTVDGTYMVAVRIADEDGSLDVATLTTKVEQPSVPTAVDSLVSVSLGLMSYDRRTLQTKMQMTITNTSQTPIYGPVWIVIKAISDSTVKLVGSSGTTSDGYQYLNVTSLLGDGRLDPGEKISTWLSFSNPLRRQFNFSYSIRGLLSPLLGP